MEKFEDMVKVEEAKPIIDKERIERWASDAQHDIVDLQREEKELAKSITREFNISSKDAKSISKNMIKKLDPVIYSKINTGKYWDIIAKELKKFMKANK